jgi:hypothetical protein
MNSPDQTSLDEHTRGDSEVSRRYRELRDEGIPAELDDAILACAREELQKTQSARRWRKWTPPFALAASAVLALSILFRSGAERETISLQRAPQAGNTAGISSAQKSSDQVASSATGSAAEPPSSRVDTAVAAKNSPAASAEMAAAPVPSKPERNLLAEPIHDKIQEQVSPISAPLPAPSAELEERRAQPPTHAQLPNEGGIAAAADRNEVPSAPAAIESKKIAGHLEQTQIAERWLKKIRTLRANGRVEDADRQWRKFRKAFPDYDVAVDDVARPKE